MCTHHNITKIYQLGKSYSPERHGSTSNFIAATFFGLRRNTDVYSLLQISYDNNWNPFVETFWTYTETSKSAQVKKNCSYKIKWKSRNLENGSSDSEVNRKITELKVIQKARHWKKWQEIYRYVGAHNLRFIVNLSNLSCT